MPLDILKVLNRKLLHEPKTTANSGARCAAILGKISTNPELPITASNWMIYGSKTKVVILWTPKSGHWPRFMTDKWQWG